MSLFGRDSLFNSAVEERRVRKEIEANARKLAIQQYEKEVMYRSLSNSDFSYAILNDLIKAAQLIGKVEVILKDGTQVFIYDYTKNGTSQTLEAEKELLY